MDKISYQIIDETAEAIGAVFSNEETWVLELSEENPIVFNYIMGEHFELLAETTKELMLYTAVTVKACMQKVALLAEVSIEKLDNAQAKNWDAIDNLPPLKQQTFEEYVEPIIGPYEQDELLYFVIDVFDQEDLEPALSKEDKIPIFVGMKSIVDVWNG